MTAGAVTVSICAVVWIIVVKADGLDSDDVAAEPPSTGTME